MVSDEIVVPVVRARGRNPLLVDETDLCTVAESCRSILEGSFLDIVE
jgi:DNA polymerase III gamma/tau subunit